MPPPSVCETQPRRWSELCKRSSPTEDGAEQSPEDRALVHLDNISEPAVEMLRSLDKLHVTLGDEPVFVNKDDSKSGVGTGSRSILDYKFVEPFSLNPIPKSLLTCFPANLRMVSWTVLSEFDR